MIPLAFEKAISDYLATVLTMPAHALAQSPNALKTIGASGICVVVYNGSTTDGKPPQIKRTMTASIMVLAPLPITVHGQIDAAYKALQGHALNGCHTITVVSDELSLLDSGLYHGEIMVEAVVVG
jgi:hypothetical protein